jgi:hypothetical protein
MADDRRPEAKEHTVDQTKETAKTTEKSTEQITEHQPVADQTKTTTTEQPGTTTTTEQPGTVKTEVDEKITPR